MSQSIENFLGLTKDEIERRIKIEDSKIMTAAKDYSGERLATYKTPEWKFLLYLAYWCPKELSKWLERYESYAGVQGSEAILEGLREEYILSQVHEPEVGPLPEPDYEPN